MESETTDFHRFQVIWNDPHTFYRSSGSSEAFRMFLDVLKNYDDAFEDAGETKCSDMSGTVWKSPPKYNAIKIEIL